MTVTISHADINPLKAQLMTLAPMIKASHRAEAMARGLRFGSNAALLTALDQGPVPCIVDNSAFSAFLQERGGEDLPDDLLSEAVVRAKLGAELAAIEAVLAHQPELCANGFRAYSPRKSIQEEAAYFQGSRAAMTKAPYVEQFARAVTFLQTKGKSTTVSRKRTSYGYKHDAETFHETANPGGDPYVANGMFIAAALHLGFTLKRDGASPNAFVNIAAAKTPRRSNQLAGSLRGPKKRTAWRNLMVASINAGLDQGLFGLAVNDNRWGSEYGIYRFDFDGLPAIACVRDIGFGELSVHAALNPTDRAEDFIRTHNAGFVVGDAFASGWLERERGPWLQASATPTGAFRAELLDQVAAAHIPAKGYADNGRVML
jgi:hypothetical protein